MIIAAVGNFEVSIMRLGSEHPPETETVVPLAHIIFSLVSLIRFFERLKNFVVIPNA